MDRNQVRVQSPGCLGRCLSLLSTLVGQARRETLGWRRKGLQPQEKAWERKVTVGMAGGYEKEGGRFGLRRC